MRFIAVLIVVTAGAPFARAEDAKDLVRAELLADVKTVKPGEQFMLGVRMEIKPGWHVYWKNPGESGAATKVKWNLPEGCKAGELLFPLPVKFDQSDVIGYGYNEQVMLMAKVTPPANLPVGQTIELSANVSWLVCEKVCIPGGAKLKLSLPVAKDAAPANEELFAKWKDRLPRPAAEEKVAYDQNGISIKWPAGMPQDVEWFPVPPESSGLEAVKTENKGDVSTISFSLVPSPASNVDMPFLVTYKDSTGKRRGVEFMVNIPPAAK